MENEYFTSGLNLCRKIEAYANSGDISPEQEVESSRELELSESDFSGATWYSSSPGTDKERLQRIPFLNRGGTSFWKPPTILILEHLLQLLFPAFARSSL